ncbi:MAG TPA: hypothetical protein VFQ51_11245, partial [Vicinamibacteria bacterium]|nr:hypothetical protein [Vicinamibacteria bacterium]
RRITEADVYEQARRLWMAHVEKDPGDPEVIWNAARFFFTNDKGLAAELLTRGMKLEPDDPRWKTQLGILQMNVETVAPGEKGAGALGLLETALAEAEGEAGRYHALAQVAEAALQAGEDAKARAYAEELLGLAERLPRDWHYGDAVHDGNRILGHVALRAADVESAKAFLLKAGATPGSPVLGSFGPSLTLAADLLAKGERDAVIQYLRMCARFWNGREEAIERLIGEIRSGGTPELNRFDVHRSGPARTGSNR